MTGSVVDPRNLRVSDAERAHVMSLLVTATGRGLINLSEFEQRSAAAVAATTRADLNGLLLDLPGLVRTANSKVAALQTVTNTEPGDLRFGAPGAAPTSPLVPTLRLDGRGSRDMRGYWLVPARIVIGGSGATRLDFRTAELTSRSVRIEFAGNRHGAVELIVPPGTVVRMDELVLRRGRMDNQVSPVRVAGGSAAFQLVLAGEKRGGWLRVRVPRRGLFHWH